MSVQGNRNSMAVSSWTGYGYDCAMGIPNLGVVGKIAEAALPVRLWVMFKPSSLTDCVELAD